MPARAKNEKIYFVKSMSKEISPELLKILVCPQSKKPLIYDKENQELLCEESGLAYKIKNGIPIMLIDEARNINPR